MKTTISGTAFVYGSNIDTDQIYPGRYLELVKPEEIAQHCMEGADETFIQRVSPGDIIVAGTNFGCGSSREHAAITLVNAGVSLVLADSFARIFYRNAINLALPLMISPGISQKVREGDRLEVDVKEGSILNKTTGDVFWGEKISEYAMHILESGGIKELFKRKMQEKQ